MSPELELLREAITFLRAEVERLEAARAAGSRGAALAIAARKRWIVIALKGIYQPGGLAPTEHAVKRALIGRRSIALEDIHDLFHEVARRKIQTRFGRLGDNPRAALDRREEFEG